jgi:hypothetical protein
LLAKEEPKEAAETDDPLKKKPKSRIPRALYHRAFAITIKHMSNTSVQRIVADVNNGIGATFLTLNALAEEGALNDWENFLEVCSALVQVAQRADDPTGKAMHGMRWSERMINIAILLRGYGHRSMANFAMFRGLFPLPSGRHIKSVLFRRAR